MQDIPGWSIGIFLAFNLAMLIRFGTVKTLLFVGALVVIQQLAGCGGGDDCDDGDLCVDPAAVQADQPTVRAPRKPLHSESI
ncbi:MAG: hypothetical protein RL375_3391 [Pseudomonadota bacterium]